MSPRQTMIAARLRQLGLLRARLSRQRAGLTAAAVFLAALLLVAFLDVRLGLPWGVRLGAFVVMLASVVKILRRPSGAPVARRG